MRKDKGLNGDLDRLPMLTWIMFLKFLAGLELQREQEWQLANPPHLNWPAATFFPARTRELRFQACHRSALSLARLGQLKTLVGE